MKQIGRKSAHYGFDKPFFLICGKGLCGYLVATQNYCMNKKISILYLFLALAVLAIGIFVIALQVGLLFRGDKIEESPIQNGQPIISNVDVFSPAKVSNVVLPFNVSIKIHKSRQLRKKPNLNSVAYDGV